MRHTRVKTWCSLGASCLPSVLCQQASLRKACLVSRPKARTCSRSARRALGQTKTLATLEHIRVPVTKELTNNQTCMLTDTYRPYNWSPWALTPPSSSSSLRCSFCKISLALHLFYLVSSCLFGFINSPSFSGNECRYQQATPPPHCKYSHNILSKTSSMKGHVWWYSMLIPCNDLLKLVFCARPVAKRSKGNAGDSFHTSLLFSLSPVFIKFELFIYLAHKCYVGILNSFGSI